MHTDRQTRLQDAALGIALGVGVLISATLGQIAGVYAGKAADMATAVAYAAVMAAALGYRRRYPASVAVVTAAAFFGAGTLHVPDLFIGTIGMFVGFYTLGAVAADRARAAWVRGAIVVGMFVWLLTQTFIEATQPTGDGPSRAGAFSPFLAYALLNILINVLYFGGAWWFGERAWASTRQRERLRERTVDLERERERTAAQAVALDRVRIARELHDVVAHHVSLMGVQAGAARAVLSADPDAAAGTLAQVEASARDALGELHQLLITLRDEDDALAGTVGLEHLPVLVAESAAAGVPASFTVVGEPRPVTPTADVALHRIAQEALTNVRRHGGPDAAADVRVRYEPDAVELEVSNTGRRASRSRDGLGLIGMRERALACGGTCEAGPRPGGGFLVRARVPGSGTPAPGAPARVGEARVGEARGGEASDA